MKPRKIFPSLYQEKDKRKHTIIIGPRQVGKTTILQSLYRKICEQEGCKGIFLDVDVFSQYEQVANLERALNTFKLHGYVTGSPFYVFLDEFQRYADLSMLLKNLYDHYPDIKLYATGSSSLVIKNQIQESLAGRKFLHFLYPLDFEEYLIFRGDEIALNLLKSVPNLEGTNLDKVIQGLLTHLNDFLIWGGYPEVCLTSDIVEKQQILQSIFDLYVKKELVEYLQIKKVQPVKQLISFLAVNHAQKIKFEELSQLTGLAIKTVKNYLQILEKTFLIHIQRPFFTNKNKELVKIPKIYFIDNGVCNFFLQNFAPIHLRSDAGFLFESFVLSEFLKNGISGDRIKFWQDKNKNEVDFVLDKTSLLIGIEVKWKSLLKKRDFRGLNAFKRFYKHSQLFLINTGQQMQDGEFRCLLPFSIPEICGVFFSNWSEEEKI